MATVQEAQINTDYQLLDPADVRKRLEKYPASVGSLEAPSDAIPHPALNGRRVMLRKEEVKTPADDAIYFVWDGGFKCWIPDAKTYDTLFASLDGIISLSRNELSSIATGPVLTPGAMLVQAEGDLPKYVLTNNQKHWVASPKVMQYCNFQNAQRIPGIVVDFIPTGAKIDYGA